MKANHKTIVLIAILVIDCIFGGVVLYSNFISAQKESKRYSNIFSVSDFFDYEDSGFIVLAEVETIALAAVEEAEPQIVYDGMTMEELGKQLDKSLKNELSGKGMLIASYSIEKGADPYIVTAIMLHETGCKWNCSRIMRECNNVGGKKGSGCGSYQYYDSLDTGIQSLIDYLAKNYFKKGLDTPIKMNKKYASDKNWYKKINNYVKQIKNA